MNDFESRVYEACRSQLVEVAESIAASARDRYRHPSLKATGPYAGKKQYGVRVQSKPGRPVRVVTYSSFAHWDEYGTGRGIFSTPSMAMRSAAAEHGELTWFSYHADFDHLSQDYNVRSYGGGGDSGGGDSAGGVE